MFTKRNWVNFGLAMAAFVILIPRSSAQTISCSSDDGRRHYCPANTEGRIRLERQRSESPCDEGYSWGSDDRGIWVDHGCRADFAIGGSQGGWDRDDDQGRDYGWNRGSGQDVVSCSSDDMHRHYCPTGGGGEVQLVQQWSESPCRRGYSWGSDRRGIWVDHGCRADFAVHERRNRGWGWGGDRDHDRDGDWGDRSRDRDWNRGAGMGTEQDVVVSCSSDDMHPHRCPADTRGGVQLLKQRSDSECRQGYSWGYDRRGIWVDHGCRADFELVR
jgi:hypothetical protein